MNNLKNFNNVYANLSESAYNTRPKNFPPFAKNKEYKVIDYSQDITYKNSEGEVSFTQGGTNLPNNGIVYLQPDPTVHEVDVKTNLQIPNPNGGYHTE
ncbi:MAG: hypothetical protein LBS33_08635, partial [Streptococcaceae bacterium]|nr:hypothetical protein [Streptococcaceae bacterium]